MPSTDISRRGVTTSFSHRLCYGLKAVAAGVLLSALLPTAAWATCEVPVERHDRFITENGRLHVTDRIAGKAIGDLQEMGIDVGGAYISEPFYNWGGVDEGGEYQGVLDVYVNADMERLGLWKGLCFHANGYQIHGNSITGANIGGLMPVTSFEATNATRLFELWFEQHMFNDTVSVRIGQLAADEEFFGSEFAGYFINGTFGWAPNPAENIPSAGPAYPLATPGVRVAVAPTEQSLLMVGVYNGDPAPNCPEGRDPQRCNSDGLEFPLEDDPFLMAEGQYNYTLGGGQLPGIIRIGGWNHFGEFADNTVDVGGNLIVITGEDGRPRDNNYGLYAVIDQLIWHRPGGEELEGVGFFARIMGSPEDRNLVDIYFDTGLVFTGMIPGRPSDALAIGFAYAGISDDVTAQDVSLGEPGPRERETLIEIAYTMEIMDGWTLQPDFQYIWNPVGDPGIDDATVVGLRNTLAF